MNSIVLIVFGAGAALFGLGLLAIAYSLRHCDCRYADGHAAGYAKGKLEADNWWYNLEAGVNREREKMWREEIER